MSNATPVKGTTYAEATEAEKHAVLRKVTGSSFLGNFIEWFDYASYSYLATVIALVFFPAEDRFVGVMSAFAVFALSFLVRPIGAIFWGNMGDKKGRKWALSVSILMMSGATFLIGCLPGYAMIGIGAPDARRLSPGFDDRLADAQCRTFLKVTAGAAKSRGLQINFEQLNPHACEYGTSTEKALSIVREVGADNLALVVDFYHRAIAGELVCDFSGFEALIRHTHISTCGAKLERGYPGMGELAYYKSILSALKAAGYKGTMSIEASAEDLLQQGAETLNMLRLAEG